MGIVSIAILVPVLDRPHRVKPLLDSIKAATPQQHRVVFICDPDDSDEHRAIKAAREPVLVLMVAGNYAAKINAGVAATDEPLIFLGADDLDFAQGWLDEACRVMIDKSAEVVGVNDLIPRTHRGEHATHFVMTRSYAQMPMIDGEPGPLHAGYAHNFVDDELIATATVRGVYAYAPKAIVEHLHPMVGADDDATYRKGRSSLRLDRGRFVKRRKLWMT